VHAPVPEQLTLTAAGPSDIGAEHAMLAEHVTEHTSVLALVQRMKLPHEPAPVHWTSHVSAVPQSTPPRHAVDPQCTTHDPPGGQVTVVPHMLPPQVMVHVLFAHVPPAAVHAVGSQPRPVASVVAASLGRPSLRRPSPGTPSKPTRPHAVTIKTMQPQRIRASYFAMSS
jgi:hypothetical protein